LGPAKYDYTLQKDEINFLLKKFPRAFLLRSTNGFKEDNNTTVKNWYAIIKDTHVDVDSIASYEGRKKIRRGLQNCTVKQVTAEFISSHGFEVFLSAFTKYKNVSKPRITPEQFEKQYMGRKSFEDIFHYWGVFSNSKLIGYAENLIYDDVEVNYSTMKFSPEFFNLYPSYALIYTMDKYYLTDCRFGYVNDGFRSILHNTNIQEFLIKNLHFKKKYTKLNIHYKKILSLGLSAIFPILPLRNQLSQRFPKLNALFTLEAIRRKNI
jgi:hypothetical protein